MAHPDGPLATLTSSHPDRIDLPRVRVVARGPKGRAAEAPLSLAPVVVGSDPACDVRIDDPRMSRRHCELRLTDRGVVVRDLGSKNGTTIAGVAVFEALLPPNGEAVAGSTRLSLGRADGQVSIALSRTVRFGDAVGASVPMRALFAQLERAAPSDETILLLGESGTGKEVLARGIHAASARRDGPFVVVDCSAIAPSMIEAELFGFTKGAFTGAAAARDGLIHQANGGTVFLDEIGELPLDLQPKLLRALEARAVRQIGSNDYRPIDVRVVAATHRELKSRVEAGAFRQDLYYRLAVVEALVPPLRHRLEDIPVLVDGFLASQRPPRTARDLPANCMELLTAHHWPGNVRELRNVVARLLLFPETALQGLGGAAPEAGAVPRALVDLPLREAREAALEQFERAYIAQRLARAAGNVSRASEAMGISRQLLHRLIERYGLRAGRDGGAGRDAADRDGAGRDGAGRDGGDRPPPRTD